MLRPERLWQQYVGKALAELMRGSGFWPLQPHPCDLEPPWDRFDRRVVNVWDCLTNGWEGPWQGGWFQRLTIPVPPLYRPGQPILIAQRTYSDPKDLRPILVQQFPDDEITIPNSEQFLLSLPRLRHPLSFEIIGKGPEARYDLEESSRILEARARGEERQYSEARIGWTEPYILVQFVAHKDDAPIVQTQLLAQYPNLAVVVGDGLGEHDLGYNVSCDAAPAATLALCSYYCQPLHTFTRLDPDPLAVAIAAMENLDRWEYALIQVLFQPAIQLWADTLRDAVEDPYNPGHYLPDDLSDQFFRHKFSTPLFAVSVRLLASSNTIFRQLLGWAEQFAAPPQGFVVNRAQWDTDEMPEYERLTLADSLDCRITHRPGMLLNLQELASLVHLPSQSIASERLRRLKSRTRPAAESAPQPGSVVLGDNLHRGQKRVARIPADLRTRHCYIAGASGTGKSTLLVNMILQDIGAGHGVGVLDPHGDLIKAVLARVPQNRVQDVILFDPADEEHPFALNILEARDENERQRIVAETVMSLERYFPSSWGPRLERILTYAIHTVLHAIRGATLADVQRVLIDEPFRRDVVSRTTDPELRQFWEAQFRFLPKNACEPVLNKLSVFLINRVVRNIVCQRHSTINFDEVLSRRKILLANLSTGLLTEKIAGTFGSFLVTKIVNAAFRRAAIAENDRHPWYLYVDEFQAFMNLSVGFDRILAEARKYKLVLAGLANQYVDQLSPAVRHAIFGNVGTFIVFRLGVDDAAIVAKEMGVFTAEEILNLEVGQAIGRAGGSKTAFNIQTYPLPPELQPSYDEEIVALNRQRYTRPRTEVEHELGRGQTESARAHGLGFSSEELPTDPSEDDLVD